VTGASSGIGRAGALALRRTGTQIVVGYYTAHRNAVERVAGAIRDSGGSAIALAGDIHRREDMQGLVSGAIQEFGRLDILLNSAGVARWQNMLDVTNEHCDWQHDVNAKGMFMACQEATRDMRKIGKRGIITITSITTQKADPLLVAYGASKGAAEMLTRDLEAALRPYNITVIAVAPGTTMNEAVLRDQERREMLMARTPLGHLSVEGAHAAARRGHRHGGATHRARGSIADFVATCWDGIANEIAKMHYMTRGQVWLPLVIRCGHGGGARFGAQHSQSIEDWAMAIPGPKVVTPSTPQMPKDCSRLRFVMTTRSTSASRKCSTGRKITFPTASTCCRWARRHASERAITSLSSGCGGNHRHGARSRRAACGAAERRGGCHRTALPGAPRRSVHSRQRQAHRAAGYRQGDPLSTRPGG
jgi:glucose 1-dehydrogenase